MIAGTDRYYPDGSANIPRGVYYLSSRAAEAYEGGREKARAFLNAREAREVIFVRGPTEGVNLVASSFGHARLQRGDEVLVTAMEHHSNIVPWQIICAERGATLRVIPMNRSGELLLDEYERLLSPRTKLVALVHLSNSLGTINPIAEIAARAHARGAVVLVDGAQAAPHMPVDVQALGCDFYTVSGHKMFGPTGIGLLFGRAELLEALPPYQGGGDMIRSVPFEKTTYAPIPAKFEAGTPHIAGVIGLGAAIDYLARLDRPAAIAHAADLLAYAEERPRTVPGVRFVGTPARRAGGRAFWPDAVHAHDVGTIV